MGNIPAYAGKTHHAKRSIRSDKEHPRVCGENAQFLLETLRKTGTSPRMRGKPAEKIGCPPSSRNIPAYAGKTFDIGDAVAGQKEHPRVCGENGATIGRGISRAGTSPRMRGKLMGGVPAVQRMRNIPAYAGKTCLRAFSPNVLSEHPRVCGENEWNTASPITQTGTSPRMRGKRPQHPAPTAYRGNIPAYAGKTILLSSRSRTSPEHPRVCGENCVYTMGYRG